MSFYIFISRRRDPLDDAGPHIPAEEWLRCADSEADFRMPVGHEREWSSPYARVWTGYRSPLIFDWVEGEIWVKNADESIIVRMKQLAGKLSATVFSEAGGLFDDVGEHAGFLPGFP